MYTLQDFRIMPFEKKCDVITFQGNYLVQRTLGDCKVFLYYAAGFFIEVFYSPKHKKVLMINAFENPRFICSGPIKRLINTSIGEMNSAI